MSDEQKLHESVEKYRGEWKIKTEWGYIKENFDLLLFMPPPVTFNLFFQF